MLHLLFLARSERVKEAEETAIDELLVVAVKLDARLCGQQTLEDVTGRFHQLNTDDANTNKFNTVVPTRISTLSEAFKHKK